MPTRLFFSTEEYLNPAMKLPSSGWEHLTLTEGGNGSVDSAGNGVLCYDLTYNPTLGRYLIVGDSGQANYETYIAWADNIDGPWNYYRDPTIYRKTSTIGALNSCVYHAGLFVIVSDDFKIWTSPTGENGSWTLRYSNPTALVISKMTSQNGFAIAVGDNGTTAYSTDAITWTVGNAGTINRVRDIIWDGTRYIAVAQAGKLAYSTSLAGPWTQSTVGITASDCWSIAYSPTLGRYCVAMLNGTVRTTTTPLTPGSFIVATGTWSGGIDSIKWANGRFVASGDGRAIGWSTNGTAFTVTSYNNSSPKADMWGVYNFDGGNTWLAVTEYYPSLIWKSTDNGVTFQPTGTENSRNAITAGLSTAQRKGAYATTPVFGTVSSGPSATVLKQLKTTTTGALNHSVAQITSIPSAIVQTAYIGAFASPPLGSNQTVGGGSIIFNCADGESNLIANFWVNTLNIYVWRPSTASIVGYVRDATDVSLGGTETVFSSATGAYVTHITGIASSTVAAQAGDIVVCEVWSRFTPGMASAYTGYFYYNGSTVNTTENALVTSHASFVEFTENLIFSNGSRPRSFVIMI